MSHSKQILSVGTDVAVLKISRN